MWKKSKVTHQTATGQGAGIKKRARLAGVMIIQFIEQLPEGKSTPDFLHKPISLTIQEGKSAIFKARVCGDPIPEVSWGRTKGDMSDTEKCQTKYDGATGEYSLEIPRVSEEDIDTYKCYATNKYGRAVCTAALNVIGDFVSSRCHHVYLHVIWQDSVMIPNTEEDNLKHSATTVGNEIIFKEDAGLYSESVEKANPYSTDFKVPSMDFLVKFHEVKAKEREDALFECLLSHPFPRMKWMGKNATLQDGEKYTITVSENKLIHRLLIKDCSQLDKGIYSAAAGLKICSAWLIVEADSDPALRGRKKARKTTQAGGSGLDLEKLAQEQEAKLALERKDWIEAANKARKEGVAQKALLATSPLDIGDKNSGEGNESGRKNNKSKGGSKKSKAGGNLVNVKEGTEMDGDPNARSGTGEPEEYIAASENSFGHARQGQLLKDTLIDKGIQYVSGLSNTNAVIGQPAELMCKLSKDNCEGAWYKDGKKLTADDRHIMSRDGPCHKLVINHCQLEDSGKYCFEADGRKTEAIFQVEDPPRFDPNDLSAFSQPVIVKAGNSATFKLPFVGREPIKIQWYRKGEELVDNNTTKIENFINQSRLLLSKCQRKDTGEIKIKLKNECGTMEAFSRLIVLEKPSVPQGPVEVLENTAFCISIKWRAPKDDGGCPVIHYNLERQQVGRNTWKKMGDVSGMPEFEDKCVEHGKKYRYRIRAVTEEGISDIMETDDLSAGALAFPSAPPEPKVASAFNDCINLTWSTPKNIGGSPLRGYNLEKRKKGSNVWSPVNPTDKPIKENKYAVADVVAGHEYEFRVIAINISGLSEPSASSEFIFARDPKKPPGKVKDLKVVDTSYTTLSLSWNKPTEEAGVQDEAKGYFIEIRQAECIDWTRCNVNPIILTVFTVKGLKAMAMYWVRVIAMNDGGNGMPQDLDTSILAMPPPVRPRFTDNKRKGFMVVKAGNSVRILLNFEASPWPDVIWLKDNVPVLKRVNISNSESSSQLLITSSERSDSGIYTIVVKNLVGQESFSVEVRVTDDPKPPGPVQLEENVPGTVTVIWEPSADEKRDDHLHYSVSKWDSTKGSWSMVADRLFNNKFTACNILPGREYHFRVYAKNDMGVSAPSESPTWGKERRKDKFEVNIPSYKTCDMWTAPAFLVPLRQRTAPKGYECYMSCAIKGNPKPRVTWYRNNVSLNTDTNYLITNTCGVCSLLILRVSPKDWGEYTIEIESDLGRAVCSSQLTVRE
ncbi:immunoglobulin-like and fibronectin type III domain-containing protein 1 [Esox lucius]|uniref:immunoglobulin-like and fibronectin type III domain-containing protein 1 n=1 Tax=Esox lucius TaxID=8010 RepID=UPI001476B25A|nr:immunoglobulin-like and fibronectin type III domain-containing protein 1 [Esox lucius]